MLEKNQENLVQVCFIRQRTGFIRQRTGFIRQSTDFIRQLNVYMIKRVKSAGGWSKSADG